MYNACALANVMGVRVRMYVRVLYRGIFHSQPSPSVDSSACMCTKQKGTRYIVYMHTNVCVLLARLVHISFGGGDSHRGVLLLFGCFLWYRFEHSVVGIRILTAELRVHAYPHMMRII